MRYFCMFFLGVGALWYIATDYNTTYAGWMCGALSMIWGDVVRHIRKAREV